MGRLKRANDNTVQENICVQQELVKQDGRLNKVYGELNRQLASGPDKRAALKTEERKWLAERDYHSKVDATTTASACVLEKTSSRADELESRLKF